MRYNIIFFILALVFSGCGSPKVKPPTKHKPKIKLNVSNDSVEVEELYFQKTKGQRFYQDTDNEVKNGWVDLNLKRTTDDGYTSFEVMSNVVTQKDYNGYGSDTIGISNLTFAQANNYCSIKLHAQLMSPYVFDFARKSNLFYKPKAPINSEIIASFDEDGDQLFAQDGDNIENDNDADSSFILINWTNEKYFNASNTYHSKETSFRCMRRK